jgi:flagellar biosynthesis component FlhA
MNDLTKANEQIRILSKVLTELLKREKIVLNDLPRMLGNLANKIQETKDDVANTIVPLFQQAVEEETSNLTKFKGH